MAKINKPFFEGKDKEDQLKVILKQYFEPTKLEEILDEIRKTGTLSEPTLRTGVLGSQETVLDMVNTITGKQPFDQPTPYTQTELKGKLKEQLIDAKKQPISEADLTDEELTKRRDIYDTLQGVKNPLEKGTIDDAMDQKFKSYGITSSYIPDYAQTDIKNQVSKFVSERGHFPTYEEIRGYAAGDKNAKDLDIYFRYPEMSNMFNDSYLKRDMDELIKTSTAEMPDAAEGMGRIEALLDTRAKKKVREGDISTFIDTTMPDELKTNREQRIKELQTLGGKQFQTLIPQLLARENAMGRLGSGAVGDVLSSTAGDIQSRIEKEAANLKAGDEDFYFNATYQKKVRDLLEARTDLSTAIGEQRTGILGIQETRFQKDQYSLDTSLANDLLMQKYQNQLEAARVAAERQRSLSRNKSAAAGYAGIGSGMVSGAVAGGTMTGGNPWGFGVGAVVGGAAAAIPVIFGDQS